MGLFDRKQVNAPAVRHEEITFLEDFSTEDWQKVLKTVEQHKFSKGDILVEIGDEDNSIYVLTSGSAEVTRPVHPGEDFVIATLPAGSVFGEIAFFDGRPRSATVRALEDGEAIRITPSAFEALAAWEPVLARRILLDLGRVLALRLRATEQRK